MSKAGRLLRGAARANRPLVSRPTHEPPGQQGRSISRMQSRLGLSAPGPPRIRRHHLHLLTPKDIMQVREHFQTEKRGQGLRASRSASESGQSPQLIVGSVVVETPLETRNQMPSTLATCPGVSSRIAQATTKVEVGEGGVETPSGNVLRAESGNKLGTFVAIQGHCIPSAIATRNERNQLPGTQLQSIPHAGPMQKK